MWLVSQEKLSNTSCVHHKVRNSSVSPAVWVASAAVEGILKLANGVPKRLDICLYIPIAMGGETCSLVLATLGMGNLSV